MAGNMRRDIEVANGQVDHVSEAIRMAISRGAILNDFKTCLYRKAGAFKAWFYVLALMRLRVLLR